MQFDEEDISYLRSLNMFEEAFLEFLKGFRPTCTVQAIPEGTLVFPHEPIVQLSGRIIETQLLESALLNMLNHQTLIATKAARICLAANGEPVMEFGLRRAHGPDGALSGSRAAYIGGCSSTSNVLAGKVYGIPVSGTQAHSWIMSFPSELEAFRAFARIYPHNCTLLVDTYDTIKSGVPNAIQVFKEMQASGVDVRPAIRLDSGDLARLSKLAHNMMLEAGLRDPLIVGSNDLDEDLIADLKRQGAKINAWGVGTHLITARDCPSLGGVYKLSSLRQNHEWVPRIKISSNPEKATDPGRKCLVRYYNRDGQPVGDVMNVEGEPYETEGEIVGRQRLHPYLHARLHDVSSARELLQPVFIRGSRTSAPRQIQSIRKQALDEIAGLPEEFKRLRNPEIYRVILSHDLGKIKGDLMEKPDLA